MVFILDGSLKRVACVCGIYRPLKTIEFEAVVLKNKCLKHITLAFFLKSYAPISDLPSNISTRPAFGHAELLKS